MGQTISYVYTSFYNHSLQNDYNFIILYILSNPDRLGIDEININIKNNNSDNLLHYFCSKNNSNIIKKLIELKCNINELNKFNETPLSILCSTYKPDLKTIELFINNGANIELSKRSILFDLMNDEEIFKYILNIVKDKNPIYRKETLFHTLCRNNKINLIKYLYETTTVCGTKNNDNKYPIEEAIEYNHVECVKLCNEKENYTNDNEFFEKYLIKSFFENKNDIFNYFLSYNNNRFSEKELNFLKKLRNYL